MEKRHVNAKFDCYQLLKILEELVVKDGLSLQDVMLGINIHTDYCEEFSAVADAVSLRTDGKGNYVLVICNKEF